jgi:DNA repair protein RadC
LYKTIPMEPYKPLSIKQWAAEDRPREKMMQNGIATLSDAELLAILLGSGTQSLSAVELSKSILANAQNNLHLLGKQTLADLTKIKGIGPAKAITIMAALELGRRRKFADAERTKITDSSVVFNVFQPLLGDLPHEEFWVAYLNRANAIIDKQRTAIGGVSATVTDIRIIIKPAIEKLASGLVLVHNHPSGNRQPSDHDKQLTRKLKEATTLFDIQLIDHVIIADTQYYSFADEGLL